MAPNDKPSPDFDQLREQMVENQLQERGITDRYVLDAMRRVPRHRFVPPRLQPLAYEDGPLPIGNEQTISQPYIVALMTQLLNLQPDHTVLEVGTGSGYQTAVLCEIAQRVYSLERHAELGQRAEAVLHNLGYDNVAVYIGDGTQGLPDQAPFDAIIITAAAPAIPGPLRSQMANGGCMVLPIGERHKQMLQRVRRVGDSWQVDPLIQVVFVPLIGRHGFGSSDEA